jgi:hypothetical protein
MQRYDAKHRRAHHPLRRARYLQNAQDNVSRVHSSCSSIKKDTRQQSGIYAVAMKPLYLATSCFLHALAHIARTQGVQ